MTETTEQVVDTAAAEGTEERTAAHEAIVETGGRLGLIKDPVKGASLTDIQKYMGSSISEMKGLSEQDKKDLKAGLEDLDTGGPGKY